MKQIFFTGAIMLFISFNCYSQTEYEKGYFINNDGDKVEGYIKNEEWKNNPEEISIKYSEAGKSETLQLKDILEFGITGETKYLRARVKIDKSSEAVSSLDQNRNPHYEEELVLLKVLIEGKASLYSYEGKNFKNFFFKTDDSGIEQLVFKSYLTNDNKVAKNNYYKQQLLNDLRCSSLSPKAIRNIQYKSDELLELFVQYNNKCSTADFQKYSIKDERTTFHMSLKAGLQNSSLEIKNSQSNSRDTDFGNQLGYRVGVEAEFSLPYNNNRWSLLLEPAYQKFTSQKEIPGLTSKVNYHSIEVPLGIRYSVFITDRSRLFTNVLVVTDLDLNSTFNFIRQGASSSLEIKSGTNLAFGLGYNYNKKYSVELRYYSNRNLLTNYGPWNSKYKSLSVILGCTLF